MLLALNKNVYYFVLFCLKFNYTSSSTFDVAKEFPGEDLSDLEFKTFRIPLSAVLAVTQQARVKSSNNDPTGVITNKMPNTFSNSKTKVKSKTKPTLSKNSTTEPLDLVTTVEPPVKTTAREPVTFVVPIQITDDGDNELVEEAAVSAPVEDVGNVPEEVAEEQPTVTEVPQQDVVGQAIRFPCQCVGGQCGCCTGVFMERLRMKACGNLTFVPEEFVFDMRFSVNNNTVLRRRVSASDPPPVCFNPRRAPFVEVCAELSNVHVRDRTAHACLDVDANVGGFSVYSTSFKCFSLGSSGIKTGLQAKPIKKPAGAPAASNLFGNNEDNDDDDDDGGLFGGGDGEGIFGGGDSEGGGLFGGGGGDGDGGGIFGGGDDGGGIFGGGDDGGFEAPDFDGALEGAGDLIGV